jgi:O-antigen/teichoic acid export membrane protein
MSRERSFAASATSGMIWMSISVLYVKTTTFLMQFVLGYILDARDYGVFAAVSVALTFVAGLQNAGAAKMLVQQQAQYQALIKDYTNFALYMGLFGAAALVALGLFFARFYRNPELVYVIGLTALSVPFTSLVSIQAARLGIDLRFRDICIIDSCVATVNIAIVLIAAHLGARVYSIGLGLVAATVVRYSLNRRITPTLNASLTLSAERFFSILAKVKWLIMTAFLTGLSQQGDYFVLGRAISPESLGYYYFGFQLTANVGQLLAQGISSTLFPIFTAMRNDIQSLGRALLRSSAVIHFTCGVLSLAVVGFVPWFMHFIWRGKWDMAIVTAVAMAMSMPMRLLSPLGTVTLDSFGKWRLRTGLLILDSGTMMLSALIGASIAGLKGASIAVALQRFFTGMVDFSAAIRTLGGNAGDIARFAGRAFFPFWLPAAALAMLSDPPTSDLSAGITAACRTLAAISAYVAIVYVLDRAVVKEVVTLGLTMMKKRMATA